MANWHILDGATQPLADMAEQGEVNHQRIIGNHYGPAAPSGVGVVLTGMLWADSTSRTQKQHNGTSFVGLWKLGEDFVNAQVDAGGSYTFGVKKSLAFRPRCVRITVEHLRFRGDNMGAHALDTEMLTFVADGADTQTLFLTAYDGTGNQFVQVSVTCAFDVDGFTITKAGDVAGAQVSAKNWMAEGASDAAAQADFAEQPLYAPLPVGKTIGELIDAINRNDLAILQHSFGSAEPEHPIIGQLWAQADAGVMRQLYETAPQRKWASLWFLGSGFSRMRTDYWGAPAFASNHVVGWRPKAIVCNFDYVAAGNGVLGPSGASYGSKALLFTDGVGGTQMQLAIATSKGTTAGHTSLQITASINSTGFTIDKATGGTASDVVFQCAQSWGVV